jgi:UDP-2,3-diacylglucosamine pyrophosphatase LpxH
MGKRLEPRTVDLLVLSDLHLGTYGCHADELLNYLQSVQPREVVLNGDIIDIWQFSKKYFPTAHLKVINHLLKWSSSGITVHYITGNHDELFRKFSGMHLSGLQIKNKLFLDLNGERTWFFHGDVFDVTMQHSKWLTRLGSVGYDLLIWLNRTVNAFRLRLNFERISFSKRIKDRVKQAVAFINNFEQTVADIAGENGVSTVVCGHIHQPTIKHIATEHGRVRYLNSGDWVENLTALEFHAGAWNVYTHNLNEIKPQAEVKELIDHSPEELFQTLMANIQQA